MEGEGVGKPLGLEASGILPFVESFDSSDSDSIVIEVEFFGLIDGVADFDSLTDVGGWDFIEGAFEADGGIVIDDPFVSDEEDLIEFLSGESSDEDSGEGGMVAVDGPLINPAMELLVIIFPEPEREGFIEFLETELLGKSREEAFADGPKEAFNLPTRGTVVRFGVDEGDACLSTASHQ